MFLADQRVTTACAVRAVVEAIMRHLLAIDAVPQKFANSQPDHVAFAPWPIACVKPADDGCRPKPPRRHLCITPYL